MTQQILNVYYFRAMFAELGRLLWFLGETVFTKTTKALGCSLESP